MLLLPSSRWSEQRLLFLEDLLQQGMRSNPVVFFKRHLYKTFEEKSSANVTGTSVLARDHLLQIFRSIFPANWLPSSGIYNYIPPMGFSRKKLIFPTAQAGWESCWHSSHRFPTAMMFSTFNSTDFDIFSHPGTHLG